MADSYREEKIRTSTLADPVSRGGTEARRCACELVGHQLAHALLDHQVLELGTRVGWVDHLASIPETSLSGNRRSDNFGSAESRISGNYGRDVLECPGSDCNRLITTGTQENDTWINVICAPAFPIRRLHPIARLR